MRSIICLALFTVCLIQTNEAKIEWQKAYKGYWAYNCDYPGDDIRVIRNVGAEKATTLCDQFAGCTHFTWNAGTLFLKGLGNRPSAQFYEASGDVICGYLGTCYRYKSYFIWQYHSFSLIIFFQN
jgi:hypothetical protein